MVPELNSVEFFTEDGKRIRNVGDIMAKIKTVNGKLFLPYYADNDVSELVRLLIQYGYKLTLYKSTNTIVIEYECGVEDEDGI